MGCKSKFNGSKGQGFCLSCQTNNVEIKRLIALHGCSGSTVPEPEKPEEEPEAVSCTPTYVEASLWDDDYLYASVSKNGGPFVDLQLDIMDTSSFKTFFEDIFMADNREGFAFLPLESLIAIPAEPKWGTRDVCGLTKSGECVNRYTAKPYKPDLVVFLFNEYEGSFPVTEAKNTLTFRPHPNSSKDYLDYFHLMTNDAEASTITVESCGVLDLGTPYFNEPSR